MSIKGKVRFVSPEEVLQMARESTHAERIEMLLRLIKISRMLKQAKVISQKA